MFLPQNALKPCHVERRDARKVALSEPKHPEDANSARLIQGILPKVSPFRGYCHYPRFRENSLYRHL